MQNAVELCSKCGDNAATAKGTPRWCANCKAVYQREYRALKEGRAGKRGFAEGVTAMREHLAIRFTGKGIYTSAEVARLIREMPGPRLD